MTTIRPNLPPLLTTPTPANAAPKSADSVRLAAQKAFFEIAAGRAPTAPTAVQAGAPPVAARAATPLAVRQDPLTEAPARPLRPGSLLDIRV